MFFPDKLSLLIQADIVTTFPPQKTLAFNSCWCRMACGSRGIAGEEGRLKLFEEFPFFVCPFSILLS